jgi:hypothetical protein
MRQRAIRIFTLAALLTAIAGNVSAQQPEIRGIFQTSATSRCIGNPRTPLCAVETLIACWVRRDRHFCEMVGSPDLSSGDAATAILGAEYFVRKTFTIRAEDIPDRLKDADWYQPGMVEIKLKIRDCFTEGTVCTGSDWLNYFGSLERVGDLWRVVGWAAVTKAFVE